MSAKSMNNFLTLIFAAALCASCRTASSNAADGDVTVPEYDGSAESMDALPDCSPEMAGSYFWVREVKTAYECGTDGQWGARGHEDPDANPSFAPRSMKD